MASCAVKLFVAATPISGPHPRPVAMEESCDSDDVIMFTIEIIFAFDPFAMLTDSSTSALSTLWERAIRIDCCSKMSGEKCASDEMIGSIFILAYLEKRNFATSAAL